MISGMRMVTAFVGRPGTGFVAYDFSHHGTLSEVHVTLVEAHLR